MSSPFPGMNPYLEHPNFWPEFHHLLISILAESLNPQVLPKYRVAIEKRIYQMSGEEALLIGIPDVTVERLRKDTKLKSSNLAVATPSVAPVSVTVPMPIEFREGYLEVRETATKEVVTAIEVLSPTNKRSRKGRQIYQEKRQAVLGSRTHLVEIDLLRGGEPMPVLDSNLNSDYRILVSRSDRRPRADLYAFNLPDRIIPFPLPLLTGDIEPVIDLQELLDCVYERAGYEVAINYDSDPIPPLLAADAAWVDSLLRQQGLR